MSHRDLIYCRQFYKCKFCFSQNDKPGSNYEKATVAQAKRIMKPFLLRRLKKDVSILEIENDSKIYFYIIVCLVFILVKYVLNLSPVLWFISHYTDMQSGFLSLFLRQRLWDEKRKFQSERGLERDSKTLPLPLVVNTSTVCQGQHPRRNVSERTNSRSRRRAGGGGWGLGP